MKVQSWDEDKFKVELSYRLKKAVKHRRQFENQWKYNSDLVYRWNSKSGGAGISVDADSITLNVDRSADDEDVPLIDSGTNYISKYIRFLHSQLVSNPPSAMSMPASFEIKDKMAAGAADAFIRHCMASTELKAIRRLVCLRTLVKGTGIWKVCWDVNGGEIQDFDEKTGELTMSGATKFSAPDIERVWFDPDATIYNEVRYSFEQIEIPREEAYALFGEEIGAKLTEMIEKKAPDYSGVRDTFTFYVYYERAMPVNGMAGRYAVCFRDGTLLQPPKPNLHHKGELPYYIFTDIDVEDQIYGKSTIEYMATNQELLNNFDTAAVDAMIAHGTIRMMQHEETETAEGMPSNDAFEVFKYGGTLGTPPPAYMNPPALPPDLSRLRMQMKDDMQEISGVNDAHMGIQRREQSGLSASTAIEAGNTVRKGLFEKYSELITNVFSAYLGLTQKYQETKVKLKVLGKEKAFELKYFSKADLEGEFDIIVDYGASLPLDPSLRRETIMILLPLLQQAGIDNKTILGMLKINDVEGAYDLATLARDRQQEYFDEMIVGKEYILPPENENHAAMLEYASYYIMTREYKTLPDEIKDYIDEHIKVRKQYTVGEAQQAAPQEQQVPQQQGSPQTILGGAQ